MECLGCGAPLVPDAVFCHRCGQAVAGPSLASMPPPPGFDPYAPPQAPVPKQVVRDPTVPDRFALGMVAAVSSGLCCTCAPIGLLSLWYADLSRKALQQGNRDLALRNSDLALRWAVAAFALAAVGLIASVVIAIAQLALMDQGASLFE